MARLPLARTAALSRLPAVFVLAAFLAAGCTTGAAGSPSASVTPTTSPAQSASASPSAAASPITEAAAKYRLIDAVGQPFFCDPDEYPVARADEAALAVERFGEVRADATVFSAIVGRLGLAASGPFTQAQQLAIYRQWKVLRAIQLGRSASGWSFDVVIGSMAKASDGQRIVGTIGPDGTVRVISHSAAGMLSCPICLARGTRIATPSGDRPVEALHEGDAVWTYDAAGRRIAGVILAVGSTPVPPSHRVVQLVLADGRTVLASPGHPLLDGRRLGDLAPGDVVDGSTVVSAVLVTYAGGATFDLLASGPTGGYSADGIPLRSTLSAPRSVPTG